MGQFMKSLKMILFIQICPKIGLALTFVGASSFFLGGGIFWHRYFWGALKYLGPENLLSATKARTSDHYSLTKYHMYDLGVFIAVNIVRASSQR